MAGSERSSVRSIKTPQRRSSLPSRSFYVPHIGFHRIFSITSYGEPSLEDFFSTGESP